MSSSSYRQSHDQSTTAAHSARSAEVEAAFLLQYLEPNHGILDIGCGPGSITRGFTDYVPRGHVVGLDLSEQVLEQARGSGERGNLDFEVGNILEGLRFKDQTFDVVYCNQTLLHIPDPVAAMKEMKRVCKRGGIIAAREADMPFHWYPYNRGLQLWDKYLYSMIFGNEDDREHPMGIPHSAGYQGGSLLHVWARKAGFDVKGTTKGVGVQAYTTPEERDWFVQTYTGRIENPETRDKIKACGATEDDLEEMVKGLHEWGQNVDGWLGIMHGELIARA